MNQLTSARFGSTLGLAGMRERSARLDSDHKDELEPQGVGIGEEGGVVSQSFNLWSDRVLSSHAALY